MSGARTLAIAVALSLLVTALGVLLPRPTAVAGLDAAPNAFSAERAVRVLTQLLADGRPHPTGSAANRALRERLERELEGLGLTPKLQRGTSCGQYGICAVVENVIAEIPGRIREPAIALAAHYDSVPAGPGAADDGAGVALLLETARALRTGPPLERSLLLLFTDGEEMGLLGARLLVEDRELIGRIGAVVNVEGRGVSGPSLMFETSTPNDGLIAAFRRSVSRPVTSSAFYAVYKRLPNDTDLTIFRRAGLAGMNFAFVGGTAHYHTPSDDLQHLSRATLQHQGDQALAVVRELTAHGVPRLEHETVFFDLFGRTVVSLTVPLFRALAFVLVVAGGLHWLRLLRREPRQRRAALFAFFGCLGAVVLSAALAGLLDAGLRLRGSLDQPWPANAALILVAAEFTALLGLTATGALLGPKFDLETGFYGVWAFVLVLTGVTAVVLPEAGYLFALPALVATVLSSALSRRTARAVEISAIGVTVAQAFVWAPVVGLAFDALGVALPSLCATLGALLGLPMIALVAGLSPVPRKRLLVATSFLALVFGAVALAGDARSKEAPARVSLAHQVDLDRGSARWLLDAVRVPPELATEADFTANRDDFPWFGGGLTARFEAPAPRLERPSPRAELLSDTAVPGGRVLELSFTAGASGVLALNLGFSAAQIAAIVVDGKPATAVVVGRYSVVGLLSPEGHSSRVRVRVTGSAPLEVLVAEISSGLPEAARRLAERRDGLSSQSQTGDITIASRTFRF